MPDTATQPLPPVGARERAVATGRGRAVRVAAGLAVAVAAAGAVVATYVVAVLEPTGRRVDDALMQLAMTAGPRRTTGALLDLVAVPTALLAVVVVAGVAVARGRRDRAVQLVVLVLGAQAVTQVLKAVLPRPGSEDVNSLPSGHVTLVAALALAVIVAVGSRMRPVVAGLAVPGVAVAGVATMVAGWHRPSDVLAAVAVVAAVAGLIGAASAVAQRGARASTVWTR